MSLRCCEIVPSLEEKYGGPSKSVYALARSLAALEADVSLLATHPTTARSHAEGRLHVESFRRGWPGGFCPSPSLDARLRRLSCDVVHHHSLWLRTLHYAHRHAATAQVPLVISPRGMMSRWAWQHHGTRKKLARHFLHPGAFEYAAGWHATSNEEAAEIRALGFKQPICVAPNGVGAPSSAEAAAAAAFWRTRCPEVTRHRTALFYARFHRKKRLLELIDLWRVRAPTDWLLLIVGLPGEYTTAQVENYALRTSGSGRVKVFDGEGRPPPYPVASLFLLPSHNENFGLAVAEAMAHGVPALVTDSTPWSSLNATGAGWCVPWSTFGDALLAALGEDAESLTRHGERAREHVLANYSWAASARTLLAFYRELKTAVAAA